MFEEFEQIAVTLINAGDHIVLVNAGFGEQPQAALPARCGLLRRSKVAVRTCAPAPQFLYQLVLEIG